MPAITYVGPAMEYDYDELMALLDNVFFLEDASPQRDFLTLLPKLYKKQYSPWENNYILKEDGVIKAAVGMYVYDAVVAGQALRIGGIGNVAVARDSRRNGYMKITMDAAMEAMQKAGCAFGMLGGQRQRYNYWGFERSGWTLGGSFNRSNLRHVGEGSTALKAYPLTDPDDLMTALAAHEGDLMHVKHAHEPAWFYDVLCSWASTPYALKDEDGIAAVFGLNREGNGIDNLRLLQPERFVEILRALLGFLPENCSSFGVSAAPWDVDLIACLEKYAENYRPDYSGSYTVLRWEETLHALLLAQSALHALPDGCITAMIRGRDSDECLRICVTGGQASVTATADDPEIELAHLEAVRFFLTHHSSQRNDFAERYPFVQNWFPLPLHWRDYDHV